jgi:hypothetical protein
MKNAGSTLAASVQEKAAHLSRPIAPTKYEFYNPSAPEEYHNKKEMMHHYLS